MYSFVFLLELNSLIILYKFVVSNFWFSEKKKVLFKKNDTKNFINMIFFQY